jgi:hypothetical protein
MKSDPETVHIDEKPQRRQERIVNDALDDALMGTFPASDPLSMVNTLIPGVKGEPRNAATAEDLISSGDAADSEPQSTPRQ